MKGKVLIGIITLAAFAIGVMTTTYALTSGPGGTAKLEIGGYRFEMAINDIDYAKLFQEKANDPAVKILAEKSFGLYELDHKLITRIADSDYDSDFSKELREVRDRMQGAFNAPDKEVKVQFDERIPLDKAEVCPGSDFYNNRINIASSDFSSMISIDDAGIAAIHGCPVGAGQKERIVVNVNVAKTLLGQADSSVTEMAAIARALPSYVVIAHR
ncbi:MAG: hypothetical protein P8079_02000 [Gammaproteobacteria bacterium]|jgi:hypothetical protein